jgi:hypothetical protein
MQSTTTTSFGLYHWSVCIIEHALYSFVILGNHQSLKWKESVCLLWFWVEEWKLIDGTSGLVLANAVEHTALFASPFFFFGKKGNNTPDISRSSPYITQLFHFGDAALNPGRFLVAKLPLLYRTYIVFAKVCVSFCEIKDEPNKCITKLYMIQCVWNFYYSSNIQWLAHHINFTTIGLEKLQL